MDPTFIIEPFAERHIAAALELEQRIFTPAWSEASFRESLQPHFRNRVVLRDGALVAYLISQWLIDEVCIFSVGVAVEWQRHGLAARLIADLIREAEQASMVTMLLEVRVSNDPAIALYRKFGFDVLIRRRKYYPDGEDAYVMHRRIDGPAIASDRKE